MKSILALCMVPVSFSYAGEFYTIIGPDGRPMVVQQKSLPKNQVTEVSESASVGTSSQETQSVTHSPNNQSEVKAITIQTKPSLKLKEEAKAAVESNQKTVPPHVEAAKIPQATYVESKIEKNEKVVTPSPSTPKKLEETAQLAISTHKDLKQAKNAENYVTVDGTQYIKNEYLEDKEFNLEGKKRFYAMPEGIIDTKHGATRLQMVEREKGVSRSLLQSFFKKNQKQDSGPITLSSTYYRVSQAEAVASLGQQCIQDKKIKDAKTVSLDKEVNVWPRAPLKQKFDFEIVKVSNAIQNVQINSYASRQQNPTFYWPFVVFLDTNGCVLEGAGGFKNHEAAESFTTHEKIEGIIHIPSQSQYMLLTPLASAIDLENKALTNQGQLKLIAIR
ncbi:putative pilus assembly protein FilE [Acinetobacter sp.]|uniref:putative pilus assembly protein FilE n=1 Tax=Acinetobacter sp. TaxID=472 RepID=UPI0028AB5CEE|nr:putative pilus assembly protein FilE [Acinetobacter sp.]